MVDRYGHVYLIDFGASKHIEQNSTLTTSLALAYTKGYCPPELADLTYESDLVQALKEIGPWTDIYALGATMYNLLTDSIPPSSNRLYKDGRNAFTFPSQISSSTQELIVWMMKPDREDRPQSILGIRRRQKQIQEENEKTIIGVDKDVTSNSNASISTSNSSSSVMRRIGRCFVWGAFFLLIIGLGIIFMSWISNDYSFNIGIAMFLGGGALWYVYLVFFEKYDSI